jgi:iron-sulfur cluster repair protein YtfE (RIC family)
MSGARPSLVRARVLERHAELCTKLELLQQLALEIDGGSAVAAERAAALTYELFDELADRLDIEEQVLMPMLRESDAWGAQRANELVKHHDQQWHELKALRARADELTALELSAGLAQLVAALRSDLMAEDCDLLAADVLRDDVLGIDVEDG